MKLSTEQFWIVFWVSIALVMLVVSIVWLGFKLF